MSGQKTQMTWKQLHDSVVSCDRCPRLRDYCAQVAKEKRRAFAQDTYWGKPVPGFGDRDAELWIVGLAPAAHGANRTGRMFTGDNSGLWLYRALHRAGFSNQPQSVGIEDGLQLENAYVSAVGRCAPPQNQPSPDEIQNCSEYLAAEWRLLKNKRVILALGAIAWKSVQQLVDAQLSNAGKTKRVLFQHGTWMERSGLVLATSFHPSQQNTFTKKLTEPMFDGVFDRVRDYLSKASK